MVIEGGEREQQHFENGGEKPVTLTCEYHLAVEYQLGRL
jgi:hypothetical protein